MAGASKYKDFVEATNGVRDDMVACYGAGHLLAGHCEEAAGELAELLAAEGYDAYFVGGRVPIPATGRGGASNWVGHCWVECDGFILDPTCEQFGSFDNLVFTFDDPSALYRIADERTLMDASGPDF
jgi:hypothetical protein